MGVLEEKEMKFFDSLCLLIDDKPRYHSTKVSTQGFDLVRKLLKQPLDNIFPVLDLFRMFLMHPNSGDMFKVSEQGMDILGTILLALREGNLQAKIMAARCLTNMFKNNSSQYCIEKTR